MRIVTRKAEPQRGDAMVWTLIVIVLLAAVGIGCWMIWHRHHTKTAAVVSVSACGPSDLSLSQGKTDSTAGTIIYKHAVATNSSAHSCTLAGYPAAFLVDSQNAVLGSGAASSSLYSVSSLTLTAGGKAHAVLGFPEVGNFSNPSTCSVASTKLKLYLPGAVLPLSAAWSDQSCPGFSVTAFQPGA